MTDLGVERCGLTNLNGLEWKTRFLAYLSESSNVSASATLSGTNTSEVYQTRRNDAEFAQAWDCALSDGYAHLEMELVRRLREGDATTSSETKYDFTNAIRLLNSYRDFSSKDSASKRVVSPAEVRAAIDAKIADLKLKVEHEKSQGKSAV